VVETRSRNVLESVREGKRKVAVNVDRVQDRSLLMGLQSKWLSVGVDVMFIVLNIVSASQK